MTTDPTARDSCADHDFGAHPDTCDPWDALVSDLRALADEGVALSLAAFWRSESRRLRRADEPRVAEGLTVEMLAQAACEIAANDIEAGDYAQAHRVLRSAIAATPSGAELLRRADEPRVAEGLPLGYESWSSHVFQPGASAPDRCLWTDGYWLACKAPADAWCHIALPAPRPPEPARTSTESTAMYLNQSFASLVPPDRTTEDWVRLHDHLMGGRCEFDPCVVLSLGLTPTPPTPVDYDAAE